VSPGLVALLVTTAAALVGGVAWRQTNGRMRAPRVRQQDVGVATADAPEGNGAVVPPVDTSAAALPTWGTTPGTPAAVPTRGTTPETTAERAKLAKPLGQKLRLTGEQIGSELGERATLVQFSSAFCAPCRATRRILADVAGMTSGVEYVEIDAESRLDLVRRLSVLRTPTVLVLDADGGVVRRASGQPRKADVIAAIGVAVGL
jgi:thiol-disulfide isomerase/thioredoxin